MSSVLSQLTYPEGARHKERRVGRGPGSRRGKVSGRGMKGQKARQPGNLGKTNFQGGQTPMQRRLPKRGFVSPLRGRVAEVRLSDLQRLNGDVIDVAALQAAGVISRFAQSAKVILSGSLERAVTVNGIGATKGARAAIEAAGGKVNAPVAADDADKATKGKLKKKA